VRIRHFCFDPKEAAETMDPLHMHMSHIIIIALPVSISLVSA
jgi:hypothetical protein